MNGRTVGYAAAGALAAIAVGLISWSAWHAARAARAPATPPPRMGASPDALDAPPAVNPATVRDIVQNSDKGHIRAYDKRDPSRLAYELTWLTLQPMQTGEVLVSSPQAVVYANERWLVHVRSERMSFRSAEGQSQPESGAFEGDTLIRIFDAQARTVLESGVNGEGPAWGALDALEPLASLRTERLAFDGALGEVSTSEPLELTAPGLAVSLGPSRVVVDEARRIVSVWRSDGGGRATYDPARARTARSEQPSGRTGSRPSSPTSTRQRDDYRAELSGDVRLSGQGRLLTAEVLELWAGLVDGGLPDGAVADVLARSSSSAPPSGGGGESPASPTSPITLQWSGPLVLRPLDSAASQLENDSLAARFTSPTSNVVLREDESGAEARAAELTYGFSSGRVQIAGSNRTDAVFELPGVGTAHTRSFDLDLLTGRGAFEGPTTLVGVDAGALNADGRSARWTERADFLLATRDGRVDVGSPQLLQEATLQGDVVLSEGPRLIVGDTLRLQQPDAGAPAGFQRVVVEGDARIAAGDGETVRADRLDGLFTPDPSDPARRTAVVTGAGNVRAERAGATLAAGLVEARLELPSGADPILRSFYAENAVEIAGPDALRITGDTARVTPAADGASLFELTGAPALASVGAGTIESPAMRYDETTATLTTFSGGELTFRPTDASSAVYDSVRVTWSGALSFDDRAGVAEVAGDVVAIGERTSVVRDTATGDRLTLTLTPGAAGARVGTGATRDPDARLLSAVIAGGASTPARVEARRMAPASDVHAEPTLEQLAFADGPSINVDLAARSVRIPGPGRLLLEDRRAATSDGDAALRGTTLFQWAGHFSVSRSAGVADMHTGVRVRRLEPDAGPVIELVCESLTSDLQPSDASDPDSRLEPTSVEAAGQVLATRGESWLRCETLRYDAAARIADAEGSPVSFFDEGFLKPETGSLLRWDIGRDRVQWRDAGSVTIPR